MQLVINFSVKWLRIRSLRAMGTQVDFRHVYSIFVLHDKDFTVSYTYSFYILLSTS